MGVGGAGSSGSAGSRGGAGGAGGASKSGGATGASKSASPAGKTAAQGTQKSQKTQPQAQKTQPKAAQPKKDVKAPDSFAPASLKACPVTGPLRSGMTTRTHPITGKTHTHKGIDISAPKGTPVKAAHDGVVSASSFQYDAKKGTGYGNHVTIDGASVRTLSAHLTERNVKVGDTVKAGDAIGTVGTTGGVTGAHLHFETSQRTADGWDRKDPQGVLSSSGLDCFN
jgi:murein DD-endopeptidase MepM/ murein hydrolase activator NlpD